MTDLLKDGLHESLSELHDHVLVSKGHLQIHLGETGLSVTSCVLHRTCTILLPMAVSLLCQCSLTVQLDSEGYDIPDQPLSWIICMSAGCNFVELACRSIGQNTRLLLNCWRVEFIVLFCVCYAATSTISSSSSCHCDMQASAAA